MDSSKFKKNYSNTPKNKKNKKKNKHKKTYQNNDEYLHRRSNKQHQRDNKILIVILLLIFITLAGLFIGNAMFNSYVMQDKELIKPTGFNMTPYGYTWANDLYGYAIAIDSNDTQSTYYFTLDQMAALAAESSNTYNFSDGIYVSYNTNNSKQIKLVTNIYKRNGDEITKPDNFDLYNFVSNARFIGRESSYCLEGFGFTEEEYKDSVL